MSIAKQLSLYDAGLPMPASKAFIDVIHGFSPSTSAAILESRLHQIFVNVPFKVVECREESYTLVYPANDGKNEYLGIEKVARQNLMRIYRRSKSNPCMVYFSDCVVKKFLERKIYIELINFAGIASERIVIVQSECIEVSLHYLLEQRSIGKKRWFTQAFVPPMSSSSWNFVGIEENLPNCS